MQHLPPTFYYPSSEQLKALGLGLTPSPHPGPATPSLFTIENLLAPRPLIPPPPRPAPYLTYPPSLPALHHHDFLGKYHQI